MSSDEQLETLLRRVKVVEDTIGSSKSPGEESLLRQSDGLDVEKLIAVLFSGRKLIALITIFSALVSVVVALSLTPTYKASSTLLPVSKKETIPSEYKGIANIAGIAVSEGSSDVSLSLEILKSQSFFEKFCNARKILPDLLAATKFDPNSGRLDYDENIYNPEKNKWNSDFLPLDVATPSIQESHRAFLELLEIETDKRGPLIKISIIHISPIVASNWVNWLVSDINTEVREQEISRANRSIEYLNNEINSTALTASQAGLFRLIQNETEKIMLAKASPDYVFKIVDPAYVPESRYRPKRKVVCVIITAIGFCLSLLFVLIREWMLENNLKVSDLFKSV